MRFIVLALAAALFLGCSQHDSVVDTVAAKSLLTKCLEAWKSGSTIDAMRQETPPVYVVDDEWRMGKTLTDFKILDEAAVIGQTSRFNVELEVSSRRYRVQYAVTTSPAQSLSRVD